MPVLYRKRIITAAIVLAVLSVIALVILYEGDDPRLGSITDVPAPVKKLEPVTLTADAPSPGTGWSYDVSYFAETLTLQGEYFENLREKFPGSKTPPDRSRVRLHLKGNLQWVIARRGEGERMIIKIIWRDRGSTFETDRDDALRGAGAGAADLSALMKERVAYLDLNRSGSILRRRIARDMPPLAQQCMLLLTEMLDVHPPENLDTDWEKEQSDPLGLYRARYVVTAQDGQLLDIYKTKEYTELFFGAGTVQASRGAEKVKRETRGNASIRWQLKNGRALSLRGRFDTNIEHAKATIKYRVSYSAGLKEGAADHALPSSARFKKILAGLTDLHMGKVVMRPRPGGAPAKLARLPAEAVASGMRKVMGRLTTIQVNDKHDGAIKTLYADVKVLVEGNPAEARARIREALQDENVSPPKKYLLAMSMILNGGREGQAFAGSLLRDPAATKDLQMAALLGMNSHTWLDAPALDALADAVSGNLKLAPKSADTSLLLAGALADKQRIAGDEAGANRLTGLLRNRLARSDEPSELTLILKGLAAARDAGSADAVRPFLSHGRLDVRVAAAEALSRMRDPRALRLVFEAVQNEKDSRARDRYVELIPGMSPIGDLMKYSGKFLKESRNHRLRRYVLTKLRLRDRKRTAVLARELRDDADPGLRELARRYSEQ